MCLAPLSLLPAANPSSDESHHATQCLRRACRNAHRVGRGRDIRHARGWRCSCPAAPEGCLGQAITDGPPHQRTITTRVYCGRPCGRTEMIGLPREGYRNEKRPQRGAAESKVPNNFRTIHGPGGSAQRIFRLQRNAIQPGMRLCDPFRSAGLRTLLLPRRGAFDAGLLYA